MVGWVWGSSEKASATRNRGGVFAGLEEEGRSRGYFRRGFGLRASTSYGECFASVNLAGAALQRAVHGDQSSARRKKTWSGLVKRRSHRELIGVALCHREEGPGVKNRTAVDG